MSLEEEIERNTLEEGVITEDGIGYKYKVLRAEFSSRLKYFVGLLKDNDNLLIISIDTPVEYRPFILAHEVICIIKLAGQPGRCKQAMEIELSRVPQEIKAEYIRFRLSFYERLIKYYDQSPDTNEFKVEIKGALEYLRSL